MVGAAKRSPTKRTYVGFFSSMSSIVSLEFVGTSETPPTVFPRTQEGFFTCMKPFVSTKVRTFRVALFTAGKIAKEPVIVI